MSLAPGRPPPQHGAGASRQDIQMATVPLLPPVQLIHGDIGKQKMVVSPLQPTVTVVRGPSKTARGIEDGCKPFPTGIGGPFQQAGLRLHCRRVDSLQAMTIQQAQDRITEVTIYHPIHNCQVRKEKNSMLSCELREAGLVIANGGTGRSSRVAGRFVAGAPSAPDRGAKHPVGPTPSSVDRFVVEGRCKPNCECSWGELKGVGLSLVPRPGRLAGRSGG
jgi:hypothetical protein